MTRRLLQKSLVIACCLFALVSGAFAATDLTISDKLLQAFHKTFPDAQQVKWAETEDKYMVNFKQGDILTKVEYDKDGNFLNSLRYYTEKNLPVNLLCRLQKKYADKKVFGVTELTTDASVEYYIKLEDAENWITVKSNVEI
ncbi:MAG TPA: hypothetical protein VKQ52_01450, partial [Puia sp.]|nr:hypothetical protein [Puia sp.]